MVERWELHFWLSKRRLMPHSCVKRYFKMIKSKLRIGNMFGRKKIRQLEEQLRFEKSKFLEMHDNKKSYEKSYSKAYAESIHLQPYKVFYELCLAGYHCMLLNKRDIDFLMKRQSLLDAGYILQQDLMYYIPDNVVFCKPQAFNP